MRDEEIKTPIIKHLNSNSKDEKIILDIGTCDGKDSIEFVDNINNSVCYAFEGDPRAKFIQHPKVTYINKAVGNINGKIEWYGSEVVGGDDGTGKIKKPDKTYYGSSSLKKPKEHLRFYPHIEFHKNEVDCIRLDDWVNENNINSVHLMWVDVNGGEREFFEGAMDTILNKTAFLLTEWLACDIYENQISVVEILSLLKNQFKVINVKGNLISLINTKYHHYKKLNIEREDQGRSNQKQILDAIENEMKFHSFRIKKLDENTEKLTFRTGAKIIEI